ncbi:IS701 family transposase (plasmid) [Streptomyces sp. BI20]|uniref:IS701 family transposase n=1 Tax=Streptomyces sp. BI20 TaxID=3403460 RepID=UPI003C77167B
MSERRTTPIRDHQRHPSRAAFIERVFGHLPRRDQRRWAETYVEGLLGTPGRKSVRRMAEALAAAPTASQSLHQFVSESPWAWDPARQALTHWIEERTSVRAWSLGTVFAHKRGDHSVGVHRRFDGALGRVVNGQVGMGIQLSTCCGDLPVDWRLHLPESWCHDPALRRRGRIPDTARHLPLWRHALDLVDTLAARTDPRPVLADGVETEDAAALLSGLGERGHRFLVTVPPGLTLLAGPHLDDRGRPRSPSTAERLCAQDHLVGRGSSLRLPRPLSLRAPGPGLVPVPDVDAATGERPGGRVGGAVRVGPARRAVRGAGQLWTLSGPVHLPGARHSLRLLAQWPTRGSRPVRIWATDPARVAPEGLLPLVEAQSAAVTSMHALREDFGLSDFEGRSFPGWHRHTTLVSAARAWHLRAGAGEHAHGWGGGFGGGDGHAAPVRVGC